MTAPWYVEGWQRGRFILYLGEREQSEASGKNLEQTEKVVDQTWASDWTWSREKQEQSTERGGEEREIEK